MTDGRSAVARPDEDGIMEAARQISGGNPPDWLLQYFRWALPTIQLYQKSAPLAFKRRDAREKLEAAKQHAKALAGILRSDISMFLDNAADKYMGASPEDFAAMLDDLAQRAEFAAKNIPEGGGRTRARPLRLTQPRQPEIKAEVFLAITLAEAWRVIHQRCFGARNNAATSAAIALWRASGASSSPDWERYFKEIGETQIGEVDTRDAWRRRLRVEAEMLSQGVGWGVE